MNREEKIEALERCNKKLYDNLEKVVDKNVREVFDVQKAIKINDDILKNLKWELMWSKYKEVVDGKEIPKVDIWEQDVDGNIRNHHSFVVSSMTKTIDSNAEIIDSGIKLSANCLKGNLKL